MKYFIYSLFLIVLSLNSYAYENMRFLKGGIAASWTKIGTITDKEEALFDIGVSSSFGYKSKNYEFAIASTAQFGRLDEDVRFKNGENTFVANGSHKSLVISPIIKKSTHIELIKNWCLYFGGGPVWSLQAVRLTSFDTPLTDETPTSAKLAYESFGGQLIIGIEEDLPYKEMHPVFIEISFMKTDSTRVSLVDTTDFKETRILASKSAQSDIDTHTIFLNMGMTIF